MNSNYIFRNLSKSNYIFLKRKYAYHVLVLFGLIIWTILLTGLVKKSPLLDEYNLSLFLFLLVLFDFILIILWIQGVSFVSSDNISILSVHGYKKYKYFLWLIFFDLKSIVFIMPVLVMTFFIMIKIGLWSGLIAIILFILFFICVELWYLNLFFLFDRLKLNLKNKVRNIFIFLFFIGALITWSIDDKILSNLPIIGWVGNAIINATNGNWINSLYYFLVLMLFSLLGFFLGLKLIRSQSDL